jgi:hypothetical protein
VEPHRPRRQLPLTQEMRLIRAQVSRRQAVRGSFEEPSKLFDVLVTVQRAVQLNAIGVPSDE